MKKALLVVLVLALASLACLSTVSAVEKPIVSTTVVTVTVVPFSTEYPQYIVCVDALNVRSVPAAQNGVLMWLETGMTVRVYEIAEGWGRLTAETGERARWVNMKYLCK